MSLGYLCCHGGHDGVPKKCKTLYEEKKRKLHCLGTPIWLSWYNNVYLNAELNFFNFLLAGQQWWTRHRYGIFRPAVDRVVPFPREDVRQRWRAGPAVHPRGSVLGRSRQQLWSHDAQWLLAGILHICCSEGTKSFTSWPAFQCGCHKKRVPVSTVWVYQQHCFACVACTV